ncbi:helix-turn-helix domain-containing protein [Ilumatobacter sp.]|uniref:helix-turn-helix domain-containing protein n=1 Tax=Ilumatobacter sp. TaxID=1967498 RepID=UPI003C5DF114
MDSARLIRDARRGSGLTLRALAERAGTSHSTLAAYEQRRKVPSVSTLDRILRAAGFAADVTLHRRVDDGDRAERGRELLEVLELAALFPAHHEPTMTYPPFGVAS